MGARTYTSLPWGPAVCRVTLFHAHPVPRAGSPGRRRVVGARAVGTPRAQVRGPRALPAEAEPPTGTCGARGPRGRLPSEWLVIGDFSVTRSSQQKVVISAALCWGGTTAAGAPWAGPGVGGPGGGAAGAAGAASTPSARCGRAPSTALLC